MKSYSSNDGTHTKYESTTAKASSNETQPLRIKSTNESSIFATVILTLIIMLHFRGQIGNNVSSELVIATFNARGLTSHTRHTLLAGDLAARKVTLCCLQETKCANGLQESCRGYKLICLPTKCRHYGLGFAVAESVADNILRYSPYARIFQREAATVL